MVAVRKIIFWVHLIAGLLAGVLIGIMSVTGIAIAFEEEILRWLDREPMRLEVVDGGGRVALGMDEIRRRAEMARPGLRFTSVTGFRDPRRAWELHAGRDGPYYVDPATGEVRDSRAGEAHDFIQGLEEWHRWLGAREGPGSAARVVTGIGNLALVVLCVTGLCLWFPRQWSRRLLRPILLLRSGARGRARDFNWHNVFGFWSVSVLLVLSATAVAISFEWGHRLVFALAGEEAPRARNYGMMAVAAPRLPVPVEGAERLPLEVVFGRVASEFPDWESIAVEFPSVEELAAVPPVPLSLGVTVPDRMPSRAYVPVRADPYSGDLVQVVRFEDRSAGLRARVWIRFLHTGAAFGLPGKVVATAGTGASLVLVWTGFALSYRRFAGRRRRPPGALA